MDTFSQCTWWPLCSTLNTTQMELQPLFYGMNTHENPITTVQTRSICLMNWYHPGQTHHRQVDIGSIQFQIDLPVDCSLTVLVEVLSHLGTHCSDDSNDKCNSLFTSCRHAKDTVWSCENTECVLKIWILLKLWKHRYRGIKSFFFFF